MVAYFVISSLLDVKLRRTQYLRICYAATAIGLSVYVLGMSGSPNQYFCKDNAISYNIIYDGKRLKPSIHCSDSTNPFTNSQSSNE